MAEVVVDGQWAFSRCHVSDVQWSTRFGEGPCGSDVASFVVDADRDDSSDWLRIGRTVEIFEGGGKRFGGKVSEVPAGFPRQIQVRGWASVEDRAVTYPGERWGRTVDNVAYTPTAATTPSYVLDASELDIGVDDAGLYTRIVATYVASQVTDPDTSQLVDVTATVTRNDTVAQTIYGIVTYQMDLTALGVITSGAATTLADNQLKEFTVPEWLSRAQVDSTILRSLGGSPAYLPNVTAGQMVRLYNVPRLMGGLLAELSLDVVLGEVEYSDAEPNVITIAPVRRAVHDLASLAEQAARLAKEAA